MTVPPPVRPPAAPPPSARPLRPAPAADRPPGPRERVAAAVRASRVYRSIVRTPDPASPAGRALHAFGNVFLHLYPVRVPRALLGLRATWRLGFVATVLFGVLLATGSYLMFVYTPAVGLAYGDMVRIRTSVGFGQLIRNVHRWSAHLMVLVVVLHLVRVFVHGAYKAPREFNWVIGVGLLLVTLGYSFTGYLLPWDQLSFWAVTVGADLLRYVPLLGDPMRGYVLGGPRIGQSTLLRFYVLHVVVLTVAFGLLMAVHIWRVRKDGLAVGDRLPDGPTPGTPRARGGARVAPEAVGAYAPPGTDAAPVVAATSAAATSAAGARAGERAGARERTLGIVRRPVDTPPERAPDEQVFTWPHLLVRHQVVALLVCCLVLALGVAFEAPLRDLANPNLTPEPAKAPWYFVGLQELLAHFDPVLAGVLAPAGLVAALVVLPYVDRNPSRQARNRRFALLAFALIFAAAAVLTVIGALFRGPGWAFVLPWEQLYFEP